MKTNKDEVEQVIWPHGRDNFNAVVMGDIHLHVNNGGITFGVIDEGFGPTIFIHQSHMGAIHTEQRVHTTKDMLRSVGEMFLAASNEDFSEDYCEVAK